MSAERPDSDGIAIVAAFKAGDVGAFETLYRERFTDLCAYVAAMVSDEDAGDVVQDVYWAVWNARDRLDVRTSDELFHYLLRAVRNRALKLIRHDRVRQRHVVEDAPDLLRQQDNTEPVDRDLLVRVGYVIDTLPSRSREVLLLRWYHGMGLEDIAGLMGISYGSVRVLHARAMAMVRERLDRG